LGARLDLVGVDPAGLDGWLVDNDAVEGAIIDDADGPEAALVAARSVRQHHPTVPILILVSAGVSPDQASVEGLAPVRLVRRPFTATQLTDDLHRLAPASSPRRPPAAAATQASVDPGEASPPAMTASRSDSLTYDRGQVLDAIRTLLNVSQLVSLEEAGDLLLEEVAEAMPEHDGAALMTQSAGAWTVAAGHGLRPNERRVLIAPTHWLMRRMANGETAVVVSGTDVARQELQSVPLSNMEHWMATTLDGMTAVVILARSGGTPFTVKDALRVRERVEPILPLLDEALLTRELAVRLTQQPR
jgi:hypothetical protein